MQEAGAAQDTSKYMYGSMMGRMVEICIDCGVIALIAPIARVARWARRAGTTWRMELAADGDESCNLIPAWTAPPSGSLLSKQCDTGHWPLPWQAFQPAVSIPHPLSNASPAHRLQVFGLVDAPTHSPCQ